MMLKEYPDILTPKEAMEILGIGKNLFYQLLKDGDIPAKRIKNKMWRILKNDLIQYIQTKKRVLRFYFP